MLIREIRYPIVFEGGCYYRHMCDESPGMPAETGDSSRLVRRLAAFATGGILLFWLVVVVLGLVTPEYSAVSDLISDLGAVNAPSGMVQQANFVILGFSVIAISFGLHKKFRDGRWPWVGVILIGVFGVFGAIGSGVFPVNNANPEALSNTLHSVGVLVGFLSVLVGLPLTAWWLANNDRWTGYKSSTAAVGIGLLGFAGIGFLLFSMNTSWPGLA